MTRALIVFFAKMFDFNFFAQASLKDWAVLVAQLAERLRPVSEVHGSNPVSGLILYRQFVFTTD